MKPPKQFIATVEQQFPAQNECANLKVVGIVRGTHEECWTQAKRIAAHPVLTFKEQNNVTH